MCGIAGSFGRSSQAPAIAAGVARMVAALAHRGPDDSGVWTDDAASLCLGNRRLAILDRSPSGHQPMQSASGRFVLTLNGEIYNHAELRWRLISGSVAPVWRGSSDTEVLLAAIDAWGVRDALSASVGMFGLAVWDRLERRLYLARDRMGEKPLYYGCFRGTWLFGSELKALAAHPLFERSIDPKAVAAYMALGYVPSPLSIHEKVRKLGTGSFVVLDERSHAAVETRYWAPTDAWREPRLQFGSDDAAVAGAEALLSQAVAQQMISDRPLGALLSGGIDSSTVVALMCAQRDTPIRTFSIGFRESSYNEAAFAAGVARHFGTEHTELYVTADDVRSIIPLMPRIYDEPFADISQLPTFLVSRLASGSVVVALTGDGGDELFGGYPRYAMGARLWNALGRLPASWRGPLGRMLERTPRAIDHAFTRIFPNDEVSGARGLRPAQKLGKLGRAMRSDDIDSLYWRLLTPWAEPSLLGPASRASAFRPDATGVEAGSVEEAFMLRDLMGYLPDGILVKVDRAAMAVSLETRAPLLDHRVAEFALRLPYRYKYRHGEGKWLLRQVLHRHIPERLVDRPKMGFAIPIASWLRGPLKPWALDLIASASSEAAHMLDLVALRRLFDRHVSGVGDWHLPLWTALMFLKWAESAEEPVDVPGAIQPAERNASSWARVG